MITVCGAGTTLDELRAIEPATPENAGRRWKAIPHADLVDTIQDEVFTRGWRIIEELYSTTRDGADMVGALLLDKVGNGSQVAVPTGMSLALGFINSNARRRALQITVGTSVMCCTNGVCTGHIVLNRVHDHTVSLIDEVEIAVDKYLEASKAIPATVAGLTNRRLVRGEASEILMEAGRRGLVGWAAIGRVDKEYRNPTFGEHGTRTSWALLNAFTYKTREHVAATRQMDVYNDFRGLLPVAGAESN